MNFRNLRLHQTKLLNILILTLCGILINIAGGGIAVSYSLPMYLDVIGTILVSVLGGYFPGITTAFATNIIGSVTNSEILYFGFINILVAIICAFAASKGYFQKIYKAVIIVPVLVLTTGVIAGLIEETIVTLHTIDQEEGTALYGLINELLSGMAANLQDILLREFYDKAISVLLVYFICRLIPESVKQKFIYSPYDRICMDSDSILKKEKKDVRHSVEFRIMTITVTGIIMIVIASAWISYHLYRTAVINAHISMAEGATELITDRIDPEKIDEYLEKGSEAEGYRASEEELYKIRESYPDVLYVYVYRILEDGCHVVFDLDTEGLKGAQAGEVIPFDNSFSKYKSRLLSGKKIDPIISNDTYGYLLTVYRPVYDKSGKCVCYACVDFSMNTIQEFGIRFILQLLAIMSSFFVFILMITFGVINESIVAPIDAITRITGYFSYKTSREYSENVRKIRSLTIDTGDEIENLYNAFLKNAEDIQDNVQKQQEQMDTIAAIAGIYVNMYEMDLAAGTVKEIQGRGLSLKNIPVEQGDDLQTTINKAVTMTIDDAYLGSLRELTDLSTINERLRTNSDLTLEIRDKMQHYSRIRILASGRDSDGNVVRALLLTEDIDQEVRVRERLQKSMENLNRANLMVEDMKEQVETLDGIAFTDALTGLGNKAAYDRDTAQYEEAIASGSADIPAFSVLMIDLNFLKKVNDTYGHEQGNIYLINCAKMISRIYGAEHSYRFGGDEFVVLLSGQMAEESEALTSVFNSEMAALKSDPQLNPWEKVSAAVGISHYTPGTDSCVDDVFKRADQNMYENKVAMKAVRTD